MNFKYTAALMLIILLAVFFNPNAASNIQDFKKINYEILEVQDKEKCFTQGLYINDYIYESCGFFNESKIRKINIKSKKVELVHYLTPNIFAEGLTVKDGRVYFLTWKNKKMYILEPDNLDKINRIRVDGEWWGLTHNDESLIASNGSHDLFYMGVDGSISENKLHVNGLDRGYQINELERVGHHIYANVFEENFIIKINEKNGKIEGYIDFSDLVLKNKKDKYMVLNGIAKFPGKEEFLITGKNWKKQYIVKLLNN